MPQVSVIIATYNRVRFLKEAIQSVLAQSYEDFELIIIDDGSTDNTHALISSIDDRRLHYIYQSNKGRSNARNVGLNVATGRYITFLDSDDLYLPDKLALQVKYLKSHPKAGMIYTAALCIDEEGNILATKYQAKVSGSIYKKIAYYVPVTITLPTVMVRREILNQVGGFDEKMYRFEDTDMWRRISKITRIDALNTYTCKLRTHDDNILFAQEPKKLVESLHYYVQKIYHEDNVQSILGSNHEIGRFYYHYACATSMVPDWECFSRELLEYACHYWPLYRYPRLRVKVILGYIKRSMTKLLKIFS